MKIIVATLLVVVLVIAVACGGTNSAPAANGPLTGNWQFNLSQQYPLPPTAVSISGFLQSVSTSLTGSVAVPTGPSGNCGGVAPLTGSVNGQNVSFSVSQNGTVLTFTGTVDFSFGTMSGSYSGPAGTCFNKPTTGTWSAFLVPAISGSFTGTLSNSVYMGDLGDTTPIPVSGTLTQSSAQGSNASVTGTITATGYPCMSTATLVGTVSGQNLILAVYSYTGEQIGYLGGGNTGAPVTIASGSSGTSLSGPFALGGTSTAGSYGPCPPIPIKFDTATAQLTLSTP